MKESTSTAVSAERDLSLESDHDTYLLVTTQKHQCGR